MARVKTWTTVDSYSGGKETVPLEFAVECVDGEMGCAFDGISEQRGKQAYDRARSAARAAGYEWPQARVEVELDPEPDENAVVDIELPLTLCVLKATGQLDENVAAAIEDCVVTGSFNGHEEIIMRGGIDEAREAAMKMGRELICYEAVPSLLALKDGTAPLSAGRRAARVAKPGPNAMAAETGTAAAEAVQGESKAGPYALVIDAPESASPVRQPWEAGARQQAPARGKAAKQEPPSISQPWDDDGEQGDIDVDVDIAGQEAPAPSAARPAKMVLPEVLEGRRAQGEDGAPDADGDGEGMPGDDGKADMARELARLRIADAEAKRKIGDIESENVRLKQEAAALEGQSADAQAKLEQARRRIAELEAEKSKADARNAELERAAERAPEASYVDNLKAEAEQAAEDAREKSALAAEAAKRASEAEERLAEGEAEARRLESEMQAKEREIAELRRSKDGLESELESERARVQALEADLDRADDDLKGAQRSQNAAVLAKDDMARKRDEAQRRLEELKAAHERDASRLREATTRLEGALEAERRRADLLESEREEARRCLDAAEDSRREYAEKCKLKDEMISDLTKQLAGKAADVQRLASELDAKQEHPPIPDAVQEQIAKAKALESDMRALEERARESERNLECERSEKSLLARELEAERAAARSLESDLRAQKELADKRASEVARLGSQLAEKSLSWASMTDKAREAEGRAKRLEEGLREARADNARLSGELADARAGAAALEEELAAVMEHSTRGRTAPVSMESADLDDFDYRPKLTDDGRIGRTYEIRYQDGTHLHMEPVNPKSDDMAPWRWAVEGTSSIEFGTEMGVRAALEAMRRAYLAKAPGPRHIK